MRKLVGLFLLCLLVAPVFAGGIKTHRKPVEPVAPYTPPETDAPPVKIVKVVEKIVKMPVKERAQNGLFAVIDGGFPGVGLKLDNGLEGLIGYQNINGNRIGFIKGAYSVYSNDYLQLKAVCAVRVNSPTNMWLLGAEGEQYIAKNVSLTGSIYPVTFTEATYILGAASLGARLYFN